MSEIPGSRVIIDRQMSEALGTVRHAIADGITVEFEETYVPPDESGVSYWGRATVELVGAYLKDDAVAVLALAMDRRFPDQLMKEFCEMLGRRVREELVRRIPDLKWINLEGRFFDSPEELERNAFFQGSG